MERVTPRQNVRVRPAEPSDFDTVLALNEAAVEYLSPLDADRLSMLHSQSARHHVAEERGSIVGFLLAFREGAAYDSPNYLWFTRRFARFVYIDRVVVAGEGRSRGFGSLLYNDLFAFAARNSVPLVTCEYDLLPPNVESERFHRRFGFQEVGRQPLAGGRKIVSLQAATVK